MDNIQSWLATADMAAQAWLNHTTPEKYTRQILRLSRETVQKTADKLLESPLPGVDTASLDSLLTRSSGRADQMATLVLNRNAPALRIELDSLRAEEKSVHEIAELLKAKQ